jgi:hypothetical protein
VLKDAREIGQAGSLMVGLFVISLTHIRGADQQRRLWQVVQRRGHAPPAAFPEAIRAAA